MKSKSVTSPYRYFLIGVFVSVIIILLSCFALLMINSQMLTQAAKKIVSQNLNIMVEQYDNFLYSIKTSIPTQVNHNGRYYNNKDSCYILLSNILEQFPDANSAHLIYDKDFFNDGKNYFPTINRNASGGYSMVDMTDSIIVLKCMPGFSTHVYESVDDILGSVSDYGTAFLSEPHYDNGDICVSYVYPFFNNKTGKLETVLSVNFPFALWWDKLFVANAYPNGELFFVTNNDYLIQKQNQSFVIRSNAGDLLSAKVNQDVKTMISKTEANRWNSFLTNDRKWFICMSNPKESDVVLFFTCPFSDIWKNFAAIMFKFMLAMFIAVLSTFVLTGFSIYRIYRLSQKEKSMEDEIQSAAFIQQSMLPKDKSKNPVLDYQASLIPAKQVGGDLYYYSLRNEYLYFCLGDVSGKGVPASLFMARTISLYCDISRYAVSPADIAESLNQELCRNNMQNMFVTAFFGIFNTKTGVLKFCNAGQEEPVYWSKAPDSKPEFLNTSFNIPLGIDNDIPFVEGEIQLMPGSVFLLFSDGVSEAMNKTDEMFGEERILQSIFQHQSDTAEAVNTVLINDIGKFVGKREQSDDITIFSLRYKPLHKELVIVNNIKDLEKLHHFMAEIQDLIQVPQNDMAMVKVAIDEAMTNVVRYAYIDENQPISILAETCGWKLIFTISDQGMPFNPLEYDKPPIEIDPDKIEDIQIGGLGISIMKDSFDELEYKYENNSNILILKKTLDYGSKN